MMKSPAVSSEAGPSPTAAQAKPLPELPTHDPFARHSGPIASSELAHLETEAVKHLQALIAQVASTTLRDAAAFHDCLFALISPLEGVFTEDLLDRLAHTRDHVQASAAEGLAKTPTNSNASIQGEAGKEEAAVAGVEKSRGASDAHPEDSEVEKEERLTKLRFFLKKHPSNASESRRTKYEAGCFTGTALFEDTAEIDGWRQEGGTIHVWAPNSELSAIDDIIRLLVFAVTHLVLEANLRRDLGLEREPIIAEAIPDTPLQRDEAPPLPIKEDISPPPSLRERRNRPWTSSLWHSLVGSKQTPAPAPASVTHPNFKDESPLSSGSGISNARDRFKSKILPPRFRTNSLGGQFDTRRKMHMDIAAQDWEVIAPQRKSLELPLIENPELMGGHSGDVPESDGEEVFQERFDQVIGRIQETKLSLSSSVHFPPPSLLVRLREQEAKLKQDLQGAALLSAKSTTSKLSRITVDSRAGLSSLMRNNNSLSGTIAHQSIQVLHERSSLFAKPTDPACSPSTWTFVSYYDFNHHDSSIYPFEDRHDVRLGTAIRQMVASADEVCEACSRRCKDHLTTCAHSSSRISIQMRESTASEIAVCDTVQDQIIAYTACVSCKEVTQPRVLSTAAASSSLAKYIECMVYDSKFQPERSALCEHAQSDGLLLSRRFIYQEHTVELTIDHIDVYDIMLPRAVDNSIEPSPPSPKSSTSTAADKLKLEIKYFYASLQAQTDCLSARKSHDLRQAAPVHENSAAAETEDKSLANESALAPLSDLRNAAKFDESTLLTELGHVSDDLFRLRNAFVNKASARKEELNKILRQDQTKSIRKALPELVQPTYLLNPAAHSLPGSDVILLDDQLGTHIAYALSCQAYHDALQSENCIDSIASALGSGSPPASTGLSGLPPRSVSSPISFSGSGFLRFANSVTSPAQKSTPTDESGISVMATRFQADKSPIGFLSLPGLRPQKSAESLSIADLQSGATTPIGSRPPSLYSNSSSSDHAEDEDEIDGIVRSKELPAPTPKTQISSTAKLPALIARATVNREREPKSSSEVNAIDVTGHFKTESEISNGSTLSTNSAKTIIPNTAAEPEIENTEDLQTPPASAYGTISSIASRGSQFLSPINSFFGLGSKGSILPAIHTEDEPHVKVKIIIKSVETEVIVYFAEEFEDLRRRCSIPHSEFIESLAQCQDFDAKGGKSESTFLNTLDQKYVLKNLPYKRFGSSDLAAFQSVAKDYFDHFKKEKRRPSVLGKIYGLFSIRCKEGPHKRNIDVLVLERLAVNANKRFDLKGISTREAKEDGCSNETFFDANWTTNFRRQSLIPLHAKATLKEALINDLEYLQQANIMDYSLLLGIDDTNQRLSCGIIDSLGRYDLAKYFESKGKLMMKTAGTKKDVTVLHPAEYAARFAASIDTALLAVPEKFSTIDRSDDEARGTRLFFCL